MATALRPSHPYVLNRTPVLDLTFEAPPVRFGANAARRFEQACHGLAQLIDISLTLAFLIFGVALAGSLLLTIPGLTLG